MTVLGIVGSPRKNGRTNALIDAALEGAGRVTDVLKIYLVDYDIRAFNAAGGSEEGVRFCPRELSDLCGDSSAMVIGAPVYWGDFNGLTKDFMDSVHIGGANGKPGLGFAIAGGSGKGLLSGVQSIYHFFYHKQMRAIEPTPVSRFNMQSALASLVESGERLARMASSISPFEGSNRDDAWPEVVAHYATLPYLNCDPVDEFLMLAEQLVASASGEKAEAAGAELLEAWACYRAGDRANAGRHAVRSYLLLYYPG